MNNIKKLAKVSGGLVLPDKTDNGETVYKIFNKTSYNKETHKFNNYVLIPSDILKLLVCATNSNTIKIYCVLLYKCNCDKSTTISNEYFTKVLGITSRTTIKKRICYPNPSRKSRYKKWTRDNRNGKQIHKTL